MTTFSDLERSFRRILVLRGIMCLGNGGSCFQTAAIEPIRHGHGF